jgi:predicted nucleic acid-binding protein
VVIDANVVFPGLYNPQGVPGQVLRAGVEGQCELLLTPAILDEIARNIVRKRPDLGPGFTRLVSEGAFVVVREAEPRGIARWQRNGLAEDSHVVAAAVAAAADFVCTGDAGIHTKMASFTGAIRTITPRELLNLLTL